MTSNERGVPLREGGAKLSTHELHTLHVMVLTRMGLSGNYRGAQGKETVRPEELPELAHRESLQFSRLTPCRSLKTPLRQL